MFQDHMAIYTADIWGTGVVCSSDGIPWWINVVWFDCCTDLMVGWQKRNDLLFTSRGRPPALVGLLYDKELLCTSVEFCQGQP